MKNNDVVSAVVGGAFFAIPYLALSIPVMPSLLIGGAAFCAGELVFKNKKKVLLRDLNPPLYKVLENAKKQNKHILDMLPLIDDEKIRKVLNEINDSVNKIILTIEKFPDKSKKLKNFFDYYLPVTIKIIDRYDEIENQKLASNESKKFYKSTNNMLEEANKAFKKMLNNLYQSDIIDTDVEMKVFNSMIKSDGLDKDEFNISKGEENDE